MSVKDKCRSMASGWCPLLGITSVCAISGVLDVLCCLPHPAFDGGARRDTDVRGERGLPAHEVRLRYHQELDRWAEHAQHHLGNATLLAVTYPENSSAPLGSSPVCILAAKSVEMRLGARVRSRLTGSALSHLVFIVRDLWKYRSPSPFTPEAVFASRKRKMAAERPPSDEEVCRAIVEGAIKTDQNYNNAAEVLRAWETDYIAETSALYFALYLVLVLLIVVVNFVVVKFSPTASKEPETEQQEPPKPKDPETGAASRRSEKTGQGSSETNPKQRGRAALGPAAAPGTARRRTSTPGEGQSQGTAGRGSRTKS